MLTPSGWVLGKDVKEGDLVATMNKETRKVEWNKINECFYYESYPNFYEIKGQTVDLLVTDKHGLIGENRKGQLKLFTAEEMYNMKDRIKLFNSVNSSGIRQNSDYIRMLIWIVTDGCIEGNAVRWHLSKQRKINRLTELLKRLDCKFTTHKQKTGNTKIRLCSDSAKEYLYHFSNGKILPEFFTRLNNQADIVLEEYSHTDGCKNKAAKNSYQISSSKEKEIDILQVLFTTSGYRATKLKRKSGYILTVNTKNGIWLTSDSVKKSNYKGPSWCVNVDNGTLLVRRNGKVTLTQNSHRAGKYYVTLRGGSYVWVEGGCLCLKKADYIKGIANWQHACVLTDFIDDFFFIRDIPIIEYKAMFGKKIFR